MFPVAIPREDAIEPTVVILTANAPRKIAGHTQYPSRRKAARLIPVAGHLFRFSEESLWWINCAVGNYAERAYK